QAGGWGVGGAGGGGGGGGGRARAVVRGVAAEVLLGGGGGGGGVGVAGGGGDGDAGGQRGDGGGADHADRDGEGAAGRDPGGGADGGRGRRDRDRRVGGGGRETPWRFSPTRRTGAGSGATTTPGWTGRSRRSWRPCAGPAPAWRAPSCCRPRSTAGRSCAPLTWTRSPASSSRSGRTSGCWTSSIRPRRRSTP